jgi:2,3-dihydroxyphenylpropionate 1,2-dioxygenase
VKTLARSTFAAILVSHSPLMPAHVGEGEVGRSFADALADTSGLLASFRPDLLVVFGSDHRRAFTTVIPTFTVTRSAHGLGDWKTATDEYLVPVEIADRLLEGLLAASFDPATANEVQLDHGIGLSTAQLVGRLDALPVIPVLINCSVPPLPKLARCAAFGLQVGRLLADLSLRIGIIGSGGLSHEPPILPVSGDDPTAEPREAAYAGLLKFAARSIRPDIDEAVMLELAAADWDDLRWLARIERECLPLTGSGGQEIRTWVAAAACASAAGPLKSRAYEAVPSWVTGMGLMVSANLEESQ